MAEVDANLAERAKALRRDCRTERVSTASSRKEKARATDLLDGGAKCGGLHGGEEGMEKRATRWRRGRVDICTPVARGT